MIASDPATHVVRTRAVAYSVLIFIVCKVHFKYITMTTVGTGYLWRGRPSNGLEPRIARKGQCDSRETFDNSRYMHEGDQRRLKLNMEAELVGTD